MGHDPYKGSEPGEKALFCNNGCNKTLAARGNRFYLYFSA